MFANLFNRAEAPMDNAIGDLGNRVVIAIPFLVALGFASASLALALYRSYGAETGNLIVAGAFVLLGIIVTLIVQQRTRARVEAAAAAAAAAEASPTDHAEGKAAPTSIFDDETLMAVVASAAPIVLPAVLRTGMKNWPLVLAAAAGLYVFSQSQAPTETRSPPRSV